MTREDLFFSGRSPGLFVLLGSQGPSLGFPLTPTEGQGKQRYSNRRNPKGGSQALSSLLSHEGRSLNPPEWQATRETGCARLGRLEVRTIQYLFPSTWKTPLEYHSQQMCIQKSPSSSLSLVLQGAWVCRANGAGGQSSPCVFLCECLSPPCVHSSSQRRRDCALVFPLRGWVPAVSFRGGTLPSLPPPLQGREANHNFLLSGVREKRTGLSEGMCMCIYGWTILLVMCLEVT